MHKSLKTTLALLAAALTVGCGSGTPANAHPAARLYLQNCAACHGAQMQGGSGGALIGVEWKHGDDLYQSISEGFPSLGMPAYRDTLTTAQIRLLVDYIEVARAQGAPPTPEPGALQRLATNDTLDYEIAVDVWARGLNLPWAMTFIDERRALITERRGTLRLVLDGELQPNPIQGTPPVLEVGQGGLMDVAIDPNFINNQWIYLAFTHSPNGTDAQTMISRGRLDGNQWIDHEVLWQAPEDSYTRSGFHFGTRIVFDNDGHLYFAIGDRGVPRTSQDLMSPNGKVHRIFTNGRIPQDNPFIGREDVLPSIFSYGHRNTQGMAFHPETGVLWTAEHGPRGGDEINITLAGLNYGWPEISYGINYNGTIITRERTHPDMEQPVWFWRPSTGLCPIVFYSGDMFPFWENKLLAGALVNETVRLLNVQNDRVIHEEIILQGRGRVRGLTVGPDGAIYVVTNSPDQILRLSKVRENIR